MSELVDRAQRLAVKHLESALPRRFRHTAAVADRAQRLASRLLPPERAEVVVASAWLHDIGYAPGLADTGFHPIDGARYVADSPHLARRRGRFGSLVGLVAHHTGAVFEARERGVEEQLAKYPVPDAVELAILSCAGLCAGPDGANVDPADRLGEVLSRYDSNHPVHRAINQSAPLLVPQAHLILAAAEATNGPPQLFPLPDWAEREPFAPAWDVIWGRDRHRITATSLGGVDREQGVEITLTDPMDPLDPAAAGKMADDLRAAAAAAAGKPLYWAQYRAFSTHSGAPVPDRRGYMAAEGPWVSATFRLDEILEFHWDMASEGRIATVDHRMFTTLIDVTEWVELVGGGQCGA